MRHKAYALLELLITTAISLMILTVVLQQMLLASKLYYKLQREFDFQHAYLAARAFLHNDLQHNIGIYTLGDRIIIQQQQRKIAYYLRDSIISMQNHMRAKTLYREDFTAPAVAIVEGLLDLQANITTAGLQARLVFKNTKILELNYAINPGTNPGFNSFLSN